MWSRSQKVVCAALLVGCSAPDLRATSQEPNVGPANATLAALRSVSNAASRLALARPLAREGSAFAAHGDAARGLRVAFPARSAGTVRVERSSMVWIEITPENLRDVAASVAASAVAYPGVAEGTDLVQLFDGDAAEELRVLHRPTAKATFGWRVHLGPALERLSANGGVLQALDHEGRARLRASPIVAWDAEGRERALDVDVEKLGPSEARIVARLDTRDLAYPIVVDPAWGATSKMANARANTTPVLLPSGKVLFAGGDYNGGPLASVESFDPTTMTWTLHAPMKTARTKHATVVLSSGKVMAIGGSGTPSYLSACEIYDPATDTWADTASLPTTVWASAAVAIGGKVILAGGAGTVATAYAFTEPSGPWVTTSTKLSAGRYDLVAAKYSATRALFIGGAGSVVTDVWDSTTNSFSVGPSLSYTRGKPGVATLTSGRLLVVGGDRTDADLFDPATQTFTLVTGIPVVHTTSVAVAAIAGDKAIYAGINSSTAKEADIFDGASLSWSRGPDTVIPHNQALAIGLADGRALVAGGLNFAGTTISDAEVYADSVAAGSTCSSGGQCTSGFCVQGVCCDRACTGTCESCTESGSVGTCKTITGSPRAGHGTCTGSGTCGGACDGTSGACTYAGTGTSCVTASCSGGIEQPAAYCDGAGACGATPATKSCGLFVCGAVTCKTTCASDADCVTSAYCNPDTSLCEAKKANGAACKNANACTSGFCAPDGATGSVCCDKACTGGCETCGASGSIGLCQLRPKDAVCGADACVGSTITASATCDGVSATCPAPSPMPCPDGFACEADGKTCKTKCATGADCATGYCDLATAKCGTPPGDAGVDSSVADALPIAEAGAPVLPEKPAVEGTFQHCTKASECATGFCVDGVCCDSACEGRCSSCALLTSPGKCTVEPIGVDLRSECGPANQCLGTCDGAGQCIGAGKGTMCGRNRCVSPTTGVGPAYCAGPGAKCPLDDAVPFDCAPYICEPAFGACRTSCTSSADCANGSVCDIPTKTCVDATPAPADDGGCLIGRAPNTKMASLLALLAVVGAVRRRRRA